MTARRKPHLLSLSASASLFVSATTSNASRSKNKFRKPVAVDAPPVSSSDEDEESGDERPKGPEHKDDDISDSSSSHGVSRRGDIRRTAFRPPRPLSRPADGKSTSFSLRQRPTAKRQAADHDGDVSSSSSRGSKRPRAKEQLVSSSSQGTGMAFNRSRKHPPRIAYGSQKTAERGGSDSAKGGPGRVSDSEDEISEPEKSASFIKPPRITPDAESPQKKFRHRKSTGTDEDETPVKKAQFKWPPGKAESSQGDVGSPPPPKTAKEAKPKVPRGATLESLKSRQKWRQRQTRKGAHKSGIFGTLGVEEAKQEETPQKAIFKMPAACGADDDQDYDNAELEAAAKDDALRLGTHSSHDSDSEGTLAYEPVVCPICNESVDNDIVRATLPGGTGDGDSVRLHLLKFDEKMSFCAAHRKRAGQKVWASRGYPDIDWGQLDTRVQQHYRHVKGVLEGTLPSTFREALQKKSGGSGSGRSSGTRGGKAGGSGSYGRVVTMPGYYGQRGQRAMSEAIVQQFSAVLRRRAVEDPLIAAHGYSQFVQDVLVPELAVQLIMEDMDVGAEKARGILGESATIGELMHEELDVVTDGEEEEVVEEEEN